MGETKTQRMRVRQRSPSSDASKSFERKKKGKRIEGGEKKSTVCCSRLEGYSVFTRVTIRRRKKMRRESVYVSEHGSDAGAQGVTREHEVEVLRGAPIHARDMRTTTETSTAVTAVTAVTSSTATAAFLLGLAQGLWSHAMVEKIGQEAQVSQLAEQCARRGQDTRVTHLRHALARFTAATASASITITFATFATTLGHSLSASLALLRGRRGARQRLIIAP